MRAALAAVPMERYGYARSANEPALPGGCLLRFELSRNTMVPRQVVPGKFEVLQQLMIPFMMDFLIDKMIEVLCSCERASPLAVVASSGTLVLRPRGDWFEP